MTAVKLKPTKAASYVRVVSARRDQVRAMSGRGVVNLEESDQPTG
jgi:hypothetical protein